MRLCVFTLLAVLILASNAQATWLETGGPSTVISPEDFWPGQTGANGGRFYDVHALPTPSELLLFVKGGAYRHTSGGPGSSCRQGTAYLEEVFVFSLPWDEDGVQSRTTNWSLVSPCLDDGENHYWGVGSVFNSHWDNEYKLFMEEFDGAAAESIDFKNVYLMSTDDPTVWRPEDRKLFLAQSTIGTEKISFLAPVLTDSGENFWWGAFNWDFVRPGKGLREVGLMKVYEDTDHSLGVHAEILAADNTWQPIPDTPARTINFVPASRWNGKINDIQKIAGKYEIWQGRHVNALDGCVSGNHGSGFLTHAIEPGKFVGKREWVFSDRNDPKRLLPTRNSSGRLYPSAITGPGGKKLLYSASIDRICPPVFGWSGMDIVVTELTEVPNPVTPQAPTLLSPQNFNSQVSTSPTLSWQLAPDALAYQVLFSEGTGSIPVNIGFSSTGAYQPTNLTPGATYRWKIRAHNSTISRDSPIWEFTVLDLAPPSTVNATDGTQTTRITVSWSPSSGAESYSVWRSETNDPATATQRAAGITGSSYSDNAAQELTRYHYWIKAHKTGAASAFSPSNDGYRNSPVCAQSVNFNQYALSSYHNQDVSGSATIDFSGCSLRLEGNTWKKINLPKTITPATRMTFRFRSSQQGEVHGIGFDVDNKVDNRVIKLFGTQAWGKVQLNDYGPSQPQWKLYDLPVGQYAAFPGSYNFVTFVNDHDALPRDAVSEIAGLDFYEPVTCSGMTFSSSSVMPYGGQDLGGNFSVEDNGCTLRLQGNTWKYIPFNHTITSSTVIEFDFKSSRQGEVHAIGLDNDNNVWDQRVIEVYGTQAWGLLQPRDYGPWAPGWKHYVVPVGSVFGHGAVSRLVFINDNDTTNPPGESVFKNVIVRN